MSGPRQFATVIPPGSRLKPLRDVIILKPLPFEPSDSIETVRFGRPVRGIVKAIGPGLHRWKYQYEINAHGQKQKVSMTRSNHYEPTEVKAGDVVELGGLNAFDGQGYEFQSILYEGETHLVCREADVCGVRDGP